MSTTSIQHPSTESKLLRNALRGNAIFCALSGLVVLLAAQALAPFTGIDNPAVFVVLGIILLPYAAFLFWVSAQETINRTFGRTAVILDVAWVIGSIIILAGNFLPLTVAGKWTIALLADAVAIFAIVQAIGLRRLEPTS